MNFDEDEGPYPPAMADWVTFLTSAHEMTSDDVSPRIKEPGVLKAFEVATYQSFPEQVKKAYIDNVGEYEGYSQYHKEVAQGLQKSLQQGLQLAISVLGKHSRSQKKIENDVDSTTNMCVFCICVPFISVSFLLFTCPHLYGKAQKKKKTEQQQMDKVPNTTGRSIVANWVKCLLPTG